MKDEARKYASEGLEFYVLRVGNLQRGWQTNECSKILSRILTNAVPVPCIICPKYNLQLRFFLTFLISYGFGSHFPSQVPIKDNETPNHQLNMLTLSKIGLDLPVIVVRAVAGLCRIFASVPVLQALADLQLPQS